MRQEIESLMHHIEPEPMSGCWLWSGYLNHCQYGVIFRSGKSWLAHRYIYTVLRGPIPEGFELDHLCRSTFCVNPDHLDPVSHAENMKRGNRYAYGEPNRVKTHCKYGHEFTAENITRGKLMAGGLCRKCRACNRERHRRRKALARAMAANERGQR